MSSRFKYVGQQTIDQDYKDEAGDNIDSIRLNIAAVSLSGGHEMFIGKQ